MRYYNVSVSDASGSQLLAYTSHPNGTAMPPDPGALNVEMDIFAVPFATAKTGSYVRLWGIPLSQIAQAFNLNNQNISIYGGMGKGLPLANSAQAGLLVTGAIQQAFANWIGTDMTLDLILMPGSAPNDAAHNLTVNWKAGTPLSQAIQNTLATAYPGYQANISISPNLVLAHDEPGFYGSLPQFAQYVKARSQDIIGGNYAGVDITLNGTTFNVFDGTTQQNPRQIDFTDLIGQPTWIDAGTVQATCVMRGDLSVGDWVKLPPSLVTVTPSAMSAYSQQRQGSIFQGTFYIAQIRHVGNYKQPSGAAWTTVLDLTIVGGGNAG